MQCNFVMELLDFAVEHNYFLDSGVYYFQTRGVAMGAKFTPSMANLFMSKWKEDVVLHDRPSGLVLWKRFIDDVLCICDGDVESAGTFLSFLNSNDRGIILAHKIQSDPNPFLGFKYPD